MAKTLREIYHQLQEIYAQPGTPAGNAYNKALSGNAGKPALPLQAGQSMPKINDTGVRRPIAGTNNPGNPPPKPASSGAPTMAPGTKLNRPTGWNPNVGGTAKAPETAPANPMMGEKKPTKFQPGIDQNSRTRSAAILAKRNASGDTAPSRPSASDSEKTGSVIRTNIERIKSRTGQNSSFEKSYNAKAGTNPRDTALDQPNSQSPMARATNPNVGGAGGSSSSFGKQSGSGTTITKPGSAQAATPSATAPKPTPKPVKQSFSQAFAAARKKAGGAGGKFTFNGKTYQTNVKGEKYQKASKLKPVGN